MGDLIVNNSFEVPTDKGPCLIELCLGSITKLKEHVDVLVISAFPGDYSPTPTSVIGALLRDLKVNVRQLSQDKEEDLRKLFSCWWSKPLGQNLPYGRILCFEGGFKKEARPPTTVSEMFRCLVSMTKNEDTTVILPLLATGDQGFKKLLMLKLIINAAIHWMKTGLPLKLLKIVIYCRKPHDPDQATRAVAKYFDELKTEWQNTWLEEAAQSMEVKVSKYDFYLSYSPRDYNVVKTLVSGIQSYSEGARIFHQHQEIDSEKSWQDEIHEVMVTCSRTIALLSPHYLENAACIEQYNIAMCCSRRSNGDTLVPLYLQEVFYLPTYMGLIQYLDCRPSDSSKILSACQMVVASFAVESQSKNDKKNAEQAIQLDDSYDVFISYSHRDAAIANEVVEEIRRKKKDWNIFYDQCELNVGVAWQAKLYHSIENSKIMLALISHNYMESKVCQEEYNLARCLDEDPNYTTKLIEVKLVDVESWPTWCAPNFMIDYNEGASMQNILNVISIENYAEENLKLPNIELPIKEITSVWRSNIAEQNFPIILGLNFSEDSVLKDLNYVSTHKFDVVLSYHETNKCYVDHLLRYLKNILPNIKFSFPTKNKSHRLKDIDEGKLIIPFLSKEYVQSSELMEEFHTSLCRHRFAKEMIIFPIVVNELPFKPAYPHIVFCLFSILDSYWSRKSGDEPALYCLSTAAKVIAAILVKNPSASTSFRTFFSMRELADWTNERNSASERHPNMPLHFYSKCLQEDSSPLLEHSSKSHENNLELAEGRMSHASSSCEENLKADNEEKYECVIEDEPSRLDLEWINKEAKDLSLKILEDSTKRSGQHLEDVIENISDSLTSSSMRSEKMGEERNEEGRCSTEGIRRDIEATESDDNLHSDELDSSRTRDSCGSDDDDCSGNASLDEREQIQSENEKMRKSEMRSQSADGKVNVIASPPRTLMKASGSQLCTCI